MDRRRALRVPVRGVAILGQGLGSTQATIENLSTTGALFVTRLDDELRGPVEVELKLGLDSGWLKAHAVRVERDQDRTRVAVEFDHVEPALAAAINTAIEGAIRAAASRPVLVVDDQRDRRRDLVARLTARGMTPLAPKTPLEAIDLLARSNLHINVALLAPSFGQSMAELHALFAHSFPWVTATDISNDVEATVEARRRRVVVERHRAPRDRDRVNSHSPGSVYALRVVQGSVLEMLGDRRGVGFGQPAVPDAIRPVSINDGVRSIEAGSETPTCGDARRHTTRDQLALHGCHEFAAAASAAGRFSTRDLIRANEQMTHTRNRTGSVAARLDRQSTSVVRGAGVRLRMVR